MTIYKKLILGGAIVVASVLISACGSVQVTNVDSRPNRYMLEYQPGAVEARAPVLNAMEKKATEYCPDGWVKVRQGESGTDYYYQMYWVVECEK
jgi:hypothetical protein